MRHCFFFAAAVSNPTFILHWNGGERLVLAFILLSLKAQNFYRKRCFAALAVALVLNHLVSITCPQASFNVLFPRLRPGGLFIIEDWPWAHVGFGSQRPDDVPLTALVFETVMALPSRRGMIADIVIDFDWAIIQRGSAAVDPTTFDISTCYSERGRSLVPPLSRSAGP